MARTDMATRTSNKEKAEDFLDRIDRIFKIYKRPCGLLLFWFSEFLFELQALRSEIQQDALVNAGCCKVVYKLDFMNRQDGLNSFQLNDKRLIYD